MIPNGWAGLQFIWPWQDRKRKFSWLKASTFLLMFLPAMWLIYQVGAERFGRFPLAGMTYWSGVWATALLLLTLAVTPVLTLFRWSQLIIVQRMIGVASLIYTIAHILIYFALRFWDFAFIANEMMTRLTLIVATVSTIGLAALGATSLDVAIRRMGATNWKRLHNTIYTFAALALIHYLLSPGIYAAQYLMTGMFFWLMVWRLLNRRGLGAEPRVLAVLAVVSSLITALSEAGWTWAYHGFEPGFTLRSNFTLTFGVSPAWQILALGVLIAAAVMIDHARRRAATG